MDGTYPIRAERTVMDGISTQTGASRYEPHTVRNHLNCTGQAEHALNTIVLRLSKRFLLMDVIQNKVAESSIQVIDLERFLPDAPVSEIDLSDFLTGGFLLREKDFRDQVKHKDWSAFRGHHVGIFCSTDAIIPTWAFMLIAAKLDGVALSVTSARAEALQESLLLAAIDGHDWSEFDDLIVVLKGCGTGQITPAAYVKATAHVQQVARKLMYGEPCSSVPIWRRPAQQ